LKENKYTYSIPIILLTRLNDIETTRYGFRAGAIKFIPKDEDSDDELLDTLRRKGLLNSEMETF
jgi:FixJ family two-component response regulator